MKKMKNLIKNTEERVSWYKTELAFISMNKKSMLEKIEEFTPEQINSFIELYDWYKDYIREQKSTNERILKDLVEEQTYLNQGLNPPFFYKNFKK